LILIVTTGQPSSNPRMLKEYFTLKKEGYAVKVIYAFWADWAFYKDEGLFAGREIDKKDFILAGGSPHFKKTTFFFSRIFFALWGILRRLHLPIPEEWSFCRPAFFLERAAKKIRADVYIGHNMGALPAIVKAAKKYKARCIFDAEDFHRGEDRDVSTPHAVLGRAMEDKYMPECDQATAASPLIAAAYSRLFPAIRWTVVNNVFSVKYLQPPAADERPDDNEELGVFWFSQLVGPDRGLELFVEAMNSLPACRITLHLMGDCPAAFKQKLMAASRFPQQLFFIDPVSPDEIFSMAAAFDIGLASELPDSANRNVCLTNKIFTYLLAGNCLLASDTDAQRQFLESYPDIGLLYRYNDAASLAGRLQQLYDDRNFLRQCRKAALELASTKFNWEKESATFLGMVRQSTPSK
jgi:glycosyltransferase involved in cell wall biosynthesis